MAVAAASVNVNGAISDGSQAVVSVFDHGFLYGEGVYEVLRTYGSRPFLLERHLRRLRNSAEMIALGVPLTDEEFSDRLAETINHAARGTPPHEAEWYIRILLTRGVGELSYDPASCPTPSVVIIVKPHAELPVELYSNGVRVIISSIVRNHPDTVNPAIKSNNLLNNALAMQEGFRRGAFEVIMRNFKGELVECAQSNFFIVKNGLVLTPPLSAGLLPGITREFLWEVGKMAGIRVSEAPLFDADLFDADEAFLTGTTREVVPIVDVDERKIASGTPGPVTKTLRETFGLMARGKGPSTLTP
jgi:branched-chain amino acid aminotransferase